MLTNIKQAIEDLKAGKLIILIDDDDREAEGDLVGLAHLATAETINFMTRFARGLICAPISESIAKKLNLNPMTSENSDPHGTAFTISVDHVSSTTGISAFERAKTIQALADEKTQAVDLHRPGHMFPLIGKNGGVLSRRGHTEASLDLAKLAGGPEAAYICEILNEDGTMARKQALYELGKEWGMTVIEVKDLARYMSFQDAPKVKLPSAYGQFDLTLFEDEDLNEHVLISKGDISDGQPLLMRLHSECLTGDIFGSYRCDCGEQLEAALKLIEQENRGAVLYLRQEGRGIGLRNKLKAYQLQEQGMDTYDANIALGFEADQRDYQVAADIINILGISGVNLMTNNPDKIQQLKDAGINIVDRTPLIVEKHVENQFYFQTKKDKFNHLFN